MCILNFLRFKTKLINKVKINEKYKNYILEKKNKFIENI